MTYLLVLVVLFILLTVINIYQLLVDFCLLTSIDLHTQYRQCLRDSVSFFKSNF